MPKKCLELILKQSAQSKLSVFYLQRHLVRIVISAIKLSFSCVDSVVAQQGKELATKLDSMSSVP